MMCPSHFGVATMACTSTSEGLKTILKKLLQPLGFAVNLINSFGALFQNTVLVSRLKKISKEFFMLEFFFTACEHEQGLSFLPPRISYSRAHMLQNSISVCCAEMQL